MLSLIAYVCIMGSNGQPDHCSMYHVKQWAETSLTARAECRVMAQRDTITTGKHSYTWQACQEEGKPYTFSRN